MRMWRDPGDDAKQAAETIAAQVEQLGGEVSEA
jgi:hypothetical protein